MAYTDINSEDRLVQATFAEHLERELGWDSVYAYNQESFGPTGTLGRSSEREAVLVRDLREALTRLPFVQYSETMPIGQKVTQHLKRVKMNVPRRFAFEATRSVLAMVVQTGGWTLTTPLNLLDAERFIPMVDILPLPFAGETRHVHLVARAEELGHLPEALARDCRRILRNVLVPRFAAIAPGFERAIEVAGDEA
jgi:hypothetical protein